MTAFIKARFIWEPILKRLSLVKLKLSDSETPDFEWERSGNFNHRHLYFIGIPRIEI